MQRRDLVPMSVYLPSEVKAEVERRAQEMSIPAATLLRMIIIGQQPPVPAGTVSTVSP